MRSWATWWAVLVLGLAAAGTTTAYSEVLYEDATAHTSATITQVLPNATTVLQTYTGVERIVLREEVFMVYWSGGAVTMLPRQYVLSLTLNKRAGAATQPGGGK